MSLALRIAAVAAVVLLGARSASPREPMLEIEKGPIDWVLGDALRQLPELLADDEWNSFEPAEMAESSLEFLPPSNHSRQHEPFVNPVPCPIASVPRGNPTGMPQECDQPLLILEHLGDRPLIPLQSKWQIDNQQLVATTNADLTAANLSTTVTLPDSDPQLDPGRPHTWGADHSVNMPLAGPLFAYGQFGATTPTVDEQPGVRWQSKYGVGVKLKPGLVDELQVRGGPAVRSDDTGRLVRGANGERSELFVEAITKFGVPLVGPLNFECYSYAVPAPTPGERNQVNQDFRLARPLPSGGQLHVGAKYRWEEAPGVTPWVERTQVYLGLQLKR